MNDAYSFWRRARKNPKAIGTYELPLFVDTPEVGYWRYFDKHKDRWIPVAFWIDEDDPSVLRCYADAQPVEPINMGDLWHRCCRFPIGYEEYQDAIAGNAFADEPPPATGHNLSFDMAEQLRLEWLAEMEIVSALKARELDQDVADQLAVMAKRLSGIRQRADDEFTREKRPHLEAGRAVDDRWRFREGVTETVTLLKRHLQPWLDTHETAGRTGARVSLRAVMVGEIVDVRAFFEAVKEHPDIQEALQKVANKLARQKVPTPGLKLREEMRAI